MSRKIIYCGTVLPMDGGPPLSNAVIVVEDRKISAVGKVTDFPDDVTQNITHNYKEEFIVPGFINAHEHVLTKRLKGSAQQRAAATDAEHVIRGIRNALQTLSEGITTLRDAGSLRGIGIEVKNAVSKGLILGPDIFAVSQGLTVTGGYAHHFFLEVDAPVEARKATGEMIKNGADWIKCMASIEWSRAAGEPLSAVNMDAEIMQAAFEVGHHHGKKCMVHAVCDEAITNSIDAGADSIEHGVMLSKKNAERMKEKDIFLVPTLSGWREQCNDWGRGSAFMKHAELIKPLHEKSIQIAREVGLKVAYGSDTLGNLSDEVHILHENGFSLEECLQIATINGAELLQRRENIGSIEVGKQADLVVLGANPIKTAKAYSKVISVFKAGREIIPEHLPL